MPSFSSFRGKLFSNLTLRSLLGKLWRLIATDPATLSTNVTTVSSTGMGGIAATDNLSTIVVASYTSPSSRLTTSTDSGITWSTTANVAGTGYPQSVVWTGSQFVALGGNTVTTSSDGVSWTTSGNIGVTFNTFSSTLKPPRYLNGKLFVSNFGPSNLYVSGASITSYTATAPRGVVAVAYGNGTYLALEQFYQQFNISVNGTWTSSDGTNWTRTLTTFPYSYTGGVSLTDATYHPNSSKFYAVGTHGSIWSTTNGASWTLVRSNSTLTASFSWYSSAGYYPTWYTTNAYYTHYGTGISYLANVDKYVIFYTNNFTNIYALKPVIVDAANLGNTAAYSTLSFSSNDARGCMAYSSTLNRYVTNPFINVEYSSNLSTWSTSSTGLTAPVPTCTKIIWGGSLFVTVGTPTNNSTNTSTSQGIMTSPDGLSWTRRSSPSLCRLDGTYTRWLNDVAYGNGTYVAVGGTSGTTPALPGSTTGGAPILTSTDGATWTLRNEGTYTTNYSYWYNGSTYVHPNALYGVCYCGGSNFVAVGIYGYILTSSDNGATWTNRSGTSALREQGSKPSIYGVAYGNGIVVAILSSISPDPGDKIIISSDNGATWTRPSTAIGASLNGILFNGTNFVVWGTNAHIMTSADGVTWTILSDGTTLNYISTLPDGQLMAAGNAGRVLLSKDGTTWTEVSASDTKTNYPLTRYNSVTTSKGVVSVTGGNNGLNNGTLKITSSTF